MKQQFDYGSYSYEYFVEESDRKTLGLEILPSLRIIVKAPFGVNLQEIEEFLERKWRWLDKNLNDMKKLHKVRHIREYVAGESYFYLGRQYLLNVEPGQDVVKMERGKIVIYTPKGLRNSEHNKTLLDAWFARRRRIVFREEYFKALELFDFDNFPQLGERIMARRWGSYTKDGKVLLNPRLIEAPREAIHYVCVHELCHKVSQKHDEVFYAELEKRIPKWCNIKESLEVRFG